MKISASTILITGGSSGLGAACVETFLQLDARVIVGDLHPPPQHLAKKYPDRIAFMPTDVVDESSLNVAITEGEKLFGTLRGAIACAGVLHAERLLPREGRSSLESFRRVVEVNLTGTFNTVRLASEAIARGEPREDNERGVVVLVSSVAALDGQIGQAAYAASKGGIASMTLPLARELAKYGIRVVTIVPGAFDTPMMQAAPEAVRRSLIDQTPFPKRLGKPAEFAQMVRHVFENPMIDGCLLRLDGGLRMGAK